MPPANQIIGVGCLIAYIVAALGTGLYWAVTDSDDSWDAAAMFFCGSIIAPLLWVGMLITRLRDGG